MKDKVNNKDFEKHERIFYEQIKKIEGSKENEAKTSLAFKNLTEIERINAFFTFIAIISSIFAYEFKNKIEYYSDDNSDIIQSLQNAQDACLAIVTSSVVFFSNHINYLTLFKYSSDYNFKIHHIV